MAEMGRPQLNKEFQISPIWTQHENFHSLLIFLTGGCFKKEELNVHVGGVDKVIVSGANQESGSFKQVFDVPPDSNMDQISATYGPELLAIKIPKKIAQEIDEGSVQREIIQPAKQTNVEERKDVEPVDNEEKAKTGKYQKEQISEGAEVPEKKLEDQKEGSGRAESIQENQYQQMKNDGGFQTEGDNVAVEVTVQKEDDDVEEFHDINCGTEAHDEKQEERDKYGSKGVLLVGDQEMKSGEKRGRREENIKGRREEWRNEDLGVSLKISSISTAMEKIGKNKAIIFTAAIAFSFGFCLSQKLGSSSSSGGTSESPCSMDVTIFERYISYRCSSANETRYSGLRR